MTREVPSKEVTYEQRGRVELRGYLEGRGSGKPEGGSMLGVFGFNEGLVCLYPLCMYDLLWVLLKSYDSFS